jgi:hypothetical protein
MLGLPGHDRRLGGAHDEQAEDQPVSDNWKRALAAVGGALLGWGSADLAYRLGMARGTHDLITYILWALGAATIAVSLVGRRGRQRDGR